MLALTSEARGALVITDGIVGVSPGVADVENEGERCRARCDVVDNAPS